MKKLLFLLILNISLSNLFAQNIIDVNLYEDSRGYFNSTFNLMYSKNNWQYFSLNDFKTDDYNIDINSYYSEHNLRYLYFWS